MNTALTILFVAYSGIALSFAVIIVGIWSHSRLILISGALVAAELISWTALWLAGVHPVGITAALLSVSLLARGQGKVLEAKHHEHDAST